jgi:soluble lytic murein transglycosylase-like protein
MRFCSQLVQWTAISMTIIATGLQAENISTVTASPASADHPVAPSVISVVRADTRTGKLVRTMVLSQAPVRSAPGPASSAPGKDPRVRSLIEETAKNFDVNPLLVESVIQVESNYNPFALSPKGAQGLMQLMPATAQRFGVTNTFDARQNIEGGIRYLKFLEDAFQDDKLAIAAYNAGEKAVVKYGNVPPYPETVNYVAKVSKKYSQAKRAAEKNKLEGQLQEKETPADNQQRHVSGYIDAAGRLHLATE